MIERSQGAGGYRETLRHPVAGRLYFATGLSSVGDYVGFGALLLVAFERSGGSPIGPAALFAVQALPALLVASVGGPWIDHFPRRAVLIGLYLAGAVTFPLPLVLPGLAPVLLAAAVAGGVRAASTSVRSGVLAEAVPRDLRVRFLALRNTTSQTAQVIGYLSGAGVTVLVGAGPALLAHAATFLAGAVIMAGLALPAPTRRPARPPMTAGLSTIFADPTLRVLAPLVWTGLIAGALPEALATVALAEEDPGWVPWAMAASPAGSAVAALMVGRSSLAERVTGQFRYVIGYGTAFIAAAALLGLHPALLVAGNAAIGAGISWSLAAQTLFANVAPPHRMAQVTATMIASLIILEGLGALAFGAVAGRYGVAGAYLAGGVVQVTAGAAALLYARARPAVTDLRRAGRDTGGGTDRGDAGDRG